MTSDLVMTSCTMRLIRAFPIDLNNAKNLKMLSQIRKKMTPSSDRRSSKIYVTVNGCHSLGSFVSTFLPPFIF
jgi:hypothetical protein